MSNPVQWEKDPGSPNYTSTCRNYVAIYKYTCRSGYACYFTFPYVLPESIG